MPWMAGGPKSRVTLRAGGPVVPFVGILRAIALSHLIYSLLRSVLDAGEGANLALS
jgi:hypothetical protein